MPLRGAALGAPLVLTAASLWGIAGLFVNALTGYGLEPVQIVFYSDALGFLILFAIMALLYPRHLAIPRAALPSMLLLGFVGGGFSFVCYISALALAGVSLATLLTSTHPAWTTLLAWRFLGEPIDRRRVLAVAAALLGCALIARAYDPGGLRANVIGIAFGLASGVSYAVYNIAGKRTLERLHPLTVTVYTSGAAMLLLLPFQSAPLPTWMPGGAWPWLIVFIVAQIVFAPVIYNLGLSRLHAGAVSLLASWELVVALLLGLLVLGESLALPQAIGAVLVVGSIGVLQLAPARREETVAC
jgi:drug/metabolite transporter (DMT)-like permease